MRHQITKLTRGHSTKAERKFMELLKKLHIPFRTKVKIKGREVDFLLGRYVVEIDAHPQDVAKNWLLLLEGYIPLHLNNWEVTSTFVEEWLKELP